MGKPEEILRLFRCKVLFLKRNNLSVESYSEIILYYDFFPVITQSASKNTLTEITLFLKVSYRGPIVSNHKASPPLEEASKQRALDFISAGIGCHALVTVDAMGILAALVEKGVFREGELDDKERFPNPLAVHAALNALCFAKVLTKEEGSYRLTTLGQELAEEIGIIAIPFGGYAEVLAKGTSIARNEEPCPSELIKWAAVIRASVSFGDKTVDPIIIDAVRQMKVKGTICDLGCGSAHRLIKICREMSLPGLGLDINCDAVEMARELVRSFPLVHIEQADVTQLCGIWEDVQVVMQSFMTHDISPGTKCSAMLRSYKTNFPNMRALLLVDVVAPDSDDLSHMPGYDYVHALLGVATRRYTETIQLFESAGYRVVKEIPISMPNTYLWILEPSLEPLDRHYKTIDRQNDKDQRVHVEVLDRVFSSEVDDPSSDR